MNTLPARCRFSFAHCRVVSMAMVVVSASVGLQAATIQMIDDKPAVEQTSLSGFGAGWKVNSSTISSAPFLSPGVLRLTDDADSARSAFYEKPLPVIAGDRGFTASFTYTASGNRQADGVAFVLHNDPRGPSALGGSGGSLGVGAGNGVTAISSSVEFEINLYAAQTTVKSLRGVAWASDGATGSYKSTGGVNLASGNPINVTLTYDPATTTLSAKLVDRTTQKSYSTSYKTLDVTKTLGSSAAYVGFAGGSGKSSAIQEISDFTYSVAGATLPKADDKPAAEAFKLSGFGGGAGWKTNGNGSYTASFPSTGVLRLTDNKPKDVASAFYEKPVPIVAGASGFSTTFTYTASGNKEADGIAFILQNDARGASALGGVGKELGVGPERGVTAVTPSVEFEIKLWRGQGIAWMSNGGLATYDSTAPVDIASGNPIEVTLSYDPPTTKLSVKLVDKTTKSTFSTSYNALDVKKIIETPTAYVGFSGSCGATTSIQEISNFSYGVAGSMAPSARSDRIVGFESGSLVVKPPIEGAVEKKIALADVISIVLDDGDRAAPGASAKPDRSTASKSAQKSGTRWRVELSPADHVTASISDWTDGNMTLVFDSLKSATLRVPIERVRAIWSTNAAKTKQAQDLNIAAESQDVAFVESDGKVKSVTGVADGLDGEFLKFKYEGAQRKIKLDRLVGVLLAQRELPAKKILYENFAFVTGDVLSGRIEALEGSVFRVAPLWTAIGADDRGVFNLPLATLARIDITDGRVTWVGDLKPVAVSQVPYFDRLMPYRVNQSLTGGPLALADGIAARGIAVHSKCVLTYDIGGGFERFRTKLGFQQPEGKIGRAAVRVLGDGKVLWQDSDLKGDGPPTLLDLNVAAVKSLVLEVGYGKNQDVAGRVVWGDARLIKSAAK